MKNFIIVKDDFLRMEKEIVFDSLSISKNLPGVLRIYLKKLSDIY